MKYILVILFFSLDVNAETSAGQGFESFKKNVYPLVVEQCSRCHSDAGPGPNHSSADALTSYKKVLGYTDFSDIKNSKFVLKGINNHYDGYLKDTDKKPTITQEELVTAFQKWWNEGENKSFFEGKKVLSEKQIPSLKDDGSFETLSWDLGDLDPKLKGAQFSVSIQKFGGGNNGMKGAYRLKNPSINSKGIAIEVKSIYVVINGVSETGASNFSRISETISSRSNKVLLDAHQIVLNENHIHDNITFAFEVLERSSQSPIPNKATKKPYRTPRPDLDIFDEAKFGKSAHFVKISAPVDFEVGTPKSDSLLTRLETPRQVRLTQPFEIQATTVTQLQWYTVMGDAPSHNRPKSIKCDRGNAMKLGPIDETICKNHPVENVSGKVVKKFIKKLNSIQKIYWYRLPTEVEWEYVARGGMPIEYRFGWGNDFDSSFAWTDSDSEARSHAVATKRPTPSPDGSDFLYDIFGNVWQYATFSFDGFVREEEEEDNYLHIDPKRNDIDMLVPKGASYLTDQVRIRTGSRETFYEPEEKDLNVGFRLVRTKR